MKTVWKFEVTLADEFDVLMPAGAALLFAQVQHGRPFFWALVDDQAPRVPRRFLLLGTGHPAPSDCGAYVGSFQLDGGALVFHLFDRGVERSSR